MAPPLLFQPRQGRVNLTAVIVVGLDAAEQADPRILSLEFSDDGHLGEMFADLFGEAHVAVKAFGAHQPRVGLIGYQQPDGAVLPETPMNQVDKLLIFPMGDVVF